VYKHKYFIVFLSIYPYKLLRYYEIIVKQSTNNFIY